jgi:leucyl-tRNA synthetase
MSDSRGTSGTNTAGTAAGEPSSEAVAPYRYTAALAGEVEQRWQDRWEAERTFEAANPAGPLADAASADEVRERPKRYVLDMFPYPSGTGLHVGHPLGYIATDVYGRYKRMDGYNVLHALGYDSFGLPAEQYAVQTGQHPRVTTDANVANMRRQLRRLGLAHDPRRSVATTDVEFYRWTQWIFLQVFNSWYDADAAKARPIAELEREFEAGSRPTPDGRAWADLTDVERRTIVDGHRLAYLSEAPVNWCPGLGTVLANEEVTAEGRSDIGNFPVFKRSMKQWMMRITAYADRLVADLDRLDWPESIKIMQRNWIGRSQGAAVHFSVESAAVEAGGSSLTVFTTRPDTLFGATFMVVSPEHSLLAADSAVVPAQWPAGTPQAWRGGSASPRAAVDAYRAEAAGRTDLERQSDRKDKSGVFTGVYAVNPANGARLPVFVADYVLMGYGTGAIMAVPGQDERDWAFAEAYDLPIVRTVQPPEGFAGRAFTGDGPAVNSGFLDGMEVGAAKAAMADWLVAQGAGESTISYKLRDWLFSRQRYWGEPFPVVYDETGLPIALPDSALPVELPELADFSPQALDPDDANSEPLPPLGRVTDWVNVELDLGDGPKTYRRELNVMPQWAGSCWYELRYLDPTNSKEFVDPEVERYWMGPQSPGDTGGVDLYVGGVEHAVLHLLYSRFWHKVLFDLGHVSSEEPFRRLFKQGYIQAFAYTDSRGQYVPAAEVVEVARGEFAWKGEPVNAEYGKMGKRLMNSVTPDDMCAEYGADTLRLYEMSMGPLDVSRPWDTRAVVGSFRFLQRAWRCVVDEQTGSSRVLDAPADEATRRALARTIEGVRRDMEGMRFNTAVAKLIELTNTLTKLPAVPREAAEPLVLMLAPLAPHAAEELWARLGHDQTLAYQPFPAADPALLVEESVTCVIQVSGKVRERLQVPPTVSEDELRALALGSEAVLKALEGRDVRTVIVRAPKLVNVVPA